MSNNNEDEDNSPATKTVDARLINTVRSLKSGHSRKQPKSQDNSLIEKNDNENE